MILFFVNENEQVPAQKADVDGRARELRVKNIYFTNVKGQKNQNLIGKNGTFDTSDEI